MLTDTALRDEGMRILAEKLGLVEAERFLVLMRREHFDYTEWRQELYTDVSLNQFLNDAQAFRNRAPK